MRFDVLKPTLHKVTGALALVIAIPLLDRVFSFWDGDMHYNGIYRISGPDHYFLAANIMKYALLILISYVFCGLAYLLYKKGRGKKE